MSIYVGSVVAVQDSTIAEMVERIEKIHGPVWEARNEFLKLIISLSSAIFAGTITFLTDNLTHDSGNLSRLVVASWLLILVSIVIGIYGLFHSTTLKSFHVRYFNQRPRLEAQLKAVNPTGDTWSQLAPIFKAAVDEAIQPLGEADARVHLATKWCVGFFVGGLAIFLIYAACRIL